MEAMFTKDTMIDGDAFEQLAHSLGLVYAATHELTSCIEGIRRQSGRVSVLSHNSDGCIVSPGTPLREYDFVWDNVPANVGHWFAQNVDVRDDRLTPLPIGLENIRWYPDLHKKDVIASLPRVENKGLLYLNVNTEIVVQREVLYQRFGNLAWCTAERGKNGIRFNHYAQQLSTHKFVLCPDGNGLDTHRTWEALYLGSFPIVERHCFTEEFAKLLPLLIIDDWDQVTEDFLNSKYDEFTSREWNWHALSIRYWEDLIRRTIA